MDTNINNAVPVEDKRGMNKTVKAVILVLVIILTILAGILSVTDCLSWLIQPPNLILLCE